MRGVLERLCRAVGYVPERDDTDAELLVVIKTWHNGHYAY